MKIAIITTLFAVALASCGSSGSQANMAPAASSTSPGGQAAAGLVKIPSGSPQLERIKAAPVTVATVPENELVAPGKVEMNPNRISKIVMPVAGRVVRVSVGLGDSVQMGKPLVTIESPEVGAAMTAYRQAESSVAQGKAGLIKAQADLDRARDLYANRAIAQKEVLSAENTFVQAKAADDQAQAAADDALRRLQILGLKPGSINQQIIVPATVNGKVIEISVVPGEYRNDTSSSLMTIANLSSVWVAADVPEKFISVVNSGEAVAITFDAYPKQVFRGRVKQIADTVDPQTRTIKVRAELENPNNKFRPEMFAQIRQSRGSRALPVVPRGAVIQSEGRNTVFVELGPGIFQETPVAIASQQDDLIALSSGVKAGDRVVVDGAMLLKAY
jgi:membrane fusion protein, heavy metal efflux system